MLEQMNVILKTFALTAAAASLAHFFSMSSAIAGPTTDVGRSRSAVANSQVEIRASRYWTCERGRGPCIYWLDDDRIIFNGSKPTDIQTAPDGRRVWRHALYIWNLQTDSVAQYAEADRAVLCYVDGYIRYERTQADDLVVIAGAIGKEVEIERRKKGERRHERQSHGWNTELLCHRNPPLITDDLSGTKVALKQKHGFLFLGAINSPEDLIKPIVYFSEANGSGLPLPISRWQASSSGIRHIGFDDSYVIWGRAEVDRNDSCVWPNTARQIFRLLPNGVVTTITIPFDERLRCYLNRFDVVLPGTVLFKGGGHAADLDLSQLFLLRKGQLSEIAKGVITDYRVSPTGCRMAVGISSNGDPHKPVTAALYRGHLKVIDFCATG